MIISENENQFLIDLKDFKKLIKKLGILEFNNDKIKRWIEFGKIDGVYEKGGLCAVYVDKNIYNLLINNIANCDKCLYKDRLGIIADILNKSA